MKLTKEQLKNLMAHSLDGPEALLSDDQIILMPASEERAQAVACNSYRHGAAAYQAAMAVAHVVAPLAKELQSQIVESKPSALKQMWMRWSSYLEMPVTAASMALMVGMIVVGMNTQDLVKPVPQNLQADVIFKSEEALFIGAFEKMGKTAQPADRVKSESLFSGDFEV